MVSGASALPHIPYVSPPFDLRDFDMVLDCESCGGQTLYQGRVAKCAYCGRCAKARLPVMIGRQLAAVDEYRRPQ